MKQLTLRLAIAVAATVAAFSLAAGAAGLRSSAANADASGRTATSLELSQDIAGGSLSAPGPSDSARPAQPRLATSLSPGPRPESARRPDR